VKFGRDGRPINFAAAKRPRLDPNTFTLSQKGKILGKVATEMFDAIVPENAMFQPRPLRKGEFTRKDGSGWLTSKELV
jgi:hypothetical protein